MKICIDFWNGQSHFKLKGHFAVLPFYVNLCVCNISLILERMAGCQYDGLYAFMTACLLLNKSLSLVTVRVDDILATDTSTSKVGLC